MFKLFDVRVVFLFRYLALAQSRRFRTVDTIPGVPKIADGFQGKCQKKNHLKITSIAFTR